MAPDLAISYLQRLRKSSVVLDPMVGSGMVVRHAAELGHHSIGLDADPLAVLMSKVWTSVTDFASIESLAKKALLDAKATPPDVQVDWIDQNDETRRFTEFWFAEPQRIQLRQLATVIANLSEKCESEANLLRVALSRIIITKSNGASLARDVSHSRPHKVADHSTYDVFRGFELSVVQLLRILRINPPPGNTIVQTGDARAMQSIGDESIDMVLTSPPYLNAIDYLRGHRLALVWLGHNIPALRKIRSDSIGAERSLSDPERDRVITIEKAMGDIYNLPTRYKNIVFRYAADVKALMLEISRVLRPKGRAVLVVGNSCLLGTFIENSEAVAKAGEIAGLEVEGRVERELPIQSRYLPIPKDLTSSLGKRMRTEVILSLAKA